ncbi:MAG TPA: alkaline phosphatase PhoX [Burkholderiales bacterium]|nr:alkaline phosphatase PhoX [Burkholderiales bacterium]
MKVSRRGFIGGAVTAATLHALGAHRAAHAAQAANRRRSEYGDVRPFADRDGRTILALPEGFAYATFSRTGEPFGDGLAVPRSHDGMTCVPGPKGLLRLIRNHEVINAAGDFSRGLRVPRELAYDAKGMGGCMALDFDPRARRLVRQFFALGGTIANCAGGLSYRNQGWITCEEVPRGIAEGYEKPHGYAFHVPAHIENTVAATPIRAMGRFAHEAAVASASGRVYETEDSGNTSGFYRYTPRTPDDLSTGRLQMLAVRGAPEASLYTGQTIGAALPVDWVDIENPDPDLEHGAPSCFRQGRARGGAAFNRLEGIFRGLDGESIYFVSTSGGPARYGQLWRYAPADDRAKADELTLVFRSPSGSVLESPDNLTISARGGILFCEDDAIGNGDAHPLTGKLTEINRLVGLSVRGEPFTFAVNLLNRSEFAGACWSPDGEILFVNLYGDSTPGSGMTCAIWGPWTDGPL